MTQDARKRPQPEAGRVLQLERNEDDAAPPAIAPGHEVGTLVRVTPGGDLWIRRPSLPCSRRVRSVVPLSVSDLGKDVLILCAPTKNGEDIVIGCFVEATPPPNSVEIDGQHIELEGRRSISMRCGKANIELRADGRIMLNGENITTKAKQANRLLGGTIYLN